MPGRRFKWLETLHQAINLREELNFGWKEKNAGAGTILSSILF